MYGIEVFFLNLSKTVLTEIVFEWISNYLSNRPQRVLLQSSVLLAWAWLAKPKAWLAKPKAIIVIPNFQTSAKSFMERPK